MVSEYLFKIIINKSQENCILSEVFNLNVPLEKQYIISHTAYRNLIIMIWDCKIFLVTYSVLFGYCIIQEYHTLSPIVWYYSGERSRDGIQQRPPHVSEQLRLRRDTLRTRLDCGESHLHCNRRIENNGCSNTLCKYVIHVYVLKSIVSEVYRLILFYHLFKKQNHQLIS